MRGSLFLLICCALAAAEAGILSRPRSSRQQLQASPSGVVGGATAVRSPPMAIVIPGDSLAEIILVDGSVKCVPPAHPSLATLLH